jgi:hypothetical protein
MQFAHELLGEYTAQLVNTSGRLWVTKGYDVFYSDDYGATFTFRTRLETQWLNHASSRWDISTRLLRRGFLHLRQLGDGTLLGVIYGAIVRCEPGSDKFTEVFARPGRTMKLEILPGGEILAGEYFYNRKRNAVCIFRSDDGGRTWSEAYRFAPGSIRHIHSLAYDTRCNSLVILTGDTDGESKVLLAHDGFATLSILSGGTQRSRAVTILATEGGYFLPTDTPFEQNYIQFLSFDGTLSERCPIVGSCLGGCQVGAWSFFATASEPSIVNFDPSVILYGTQNGVEWHVIHRWRVDRWSWPTHIQAAAFQFGRVVMPAGENVTGYLFGTPVAIRKNDGQLHRWKLFDGNGKGRT